MTRRTHAAYGSRRQIPGLPWRRVFRLTGLLVIVAALGFYCYSAQETVRRISGDHYPTERSRTAHEAPIRHIQLAAARLPQSPDNPEVEKTKDPCDQRTGPLKDFCDSGNDKPNETAAPDVTTSPSPSKTPKEEDTSDPCRLVKGPAKDFCQSGPDDAPPTVDTPLDPLTQMVQFVTEWTHKTSLYVHVWLMSQFIKIPTPVLSDQPDSAFVFLREKAAGWWTGVIALGGIFIAGSLGAIQRKGEPFKKIFSDLIYLVYVTFPVVAIINLANLAGDKSSTWLLNQATPDQNWAAHWLGGLTAAGLPTEVAGTGPLPATMILIIVALVSIVTHLVLIAMMYFRNVAMLTLVGLWPIVAAARFSAIGKRLSSWVASQVVFWSIWKYIMAVLLAVEEKLLTSQYATENYMGMALGLGMVFAPFAIMRAIVPGITEVDSAGQGFFSSLRRVGHLVYGGTAQNFAHGRNIAFPGGWPKGGLGAIGRRRRPGDGQNNQGNDQPSPRNGPTGPRPATPALRQASNVDLKKSPVKNRTDWWKDTPTLNLDLKKSPVKNATGPAVDTPTLNLNIKKPQVDTPTINFGPPVNSPPRTHSSGPGSNSSPPLMTWSAFKASQERAPGSGPSGSNTT